MKEVYTNVKSATYDLEVLKRPIPRIFKGKSPLTGKAKYINHIYEQNGKGNYRSIFNPSTKEMLGIAYHSGRKNKKYEWEVKFFKKRKETQIKNGFNKKLH